MLMTACQTVSTGINKLGYQKIDEANAKIAQIEKNAQAQQDALSRKWQEDLNKAIQLQTDKMQGAADQLFASEFAYSLNPNPDRNAVVINFHVKSAVDYIRLAPSPSAVAKYMQEVKDELNEAKTSIVDLQKKYDAEHVKAETLEIEKQKVEAEIKTIAQQKIDVEKAKNDEITVINAAKDKTAKELLDKQQDDLNKANDHKQLVKTLMYWTGAIALAALIASIYLPVMKSESITLAAILGAITVALPFVELWMIGLGAGLVIVGLIGWMIYKHNNQLVAKDKLLATEKTISSNLVNVIQDVKEKSKDLYDTQIKPSLEEWNTKYIKHEDGTTTKVVDKAVTQAIDAKLVEAQRL